MKNLRMNKPKYSIDPNAKLVEKKSRTGSPKFYYDDIDITHDLHLEEVYRRIVDVPLQNLEKSAGTYYAKLALNRLSIDSNKKFGKSYMACSAKRIDDEKEKQSLNTKYSFYYWLNYGDGTTYGRFSVEQVKRWLFEDDVLLIDMGGSDEYPERTKAKRLEIEERIKIQDCIS